MTQQVAQSRSRAQRVPLGAFVDAAQHRELRELAREEDRSVSSIVRRALERELALTGESEQERTKEQA